MQTSDDSEVQAAFVAHEAGRIGVVRLPPPRLLFGPYCVPRIGVGDWVECARFGSVRVVGWSDGPLRWPLCQIGGPRSLILFADLTRAVEREGAIVVALTWGVSRVTVHKWRLALNVGRANAGSARRWKENVPLVLEEAQNQLGLERAQASEARRKAEATKRERGHIGCKIAWTNEQIGWMGRVTDAEIARRAGCNPRAVERERRRRNIARVPTGELTKGFENIDAAKLRARLVALGWMQKDLAARYGCTHSQINDICRGAKTRVKTVTLRKLARALKCKPADLRV